MKIKTGKKTKPASSGPAFDFSKSFQSRMVRVLFDDPNFTITTGIRLEPSHFENRVHRFFAGTIINYAKNHGHGISLDGVKIEFKRGLRAGRLQKADVADAKAFIKRLTKPVSDKTYIREQLYNFIKHRAIYSAFEEGLRHFDAHDYEAVDEVFGKAIEVQTSLADGLGSFFVRDVAERTKRRKKYVKDGISTGFRLDDFLKPGGAKRRTIATWVAPSGIGKSHCLVNTGASAIIESNAKVLHVTLELSEEDICDRYDARFSQIPLNALEQKPVGVKRAIKDIGKKYGDALVVKEFAPATLTVPALRAYIRQLERHGFYPDVVIVDYADEMLPSLATRDRDPYEDMGTIYRELRKLAFDLNVVVWTASQTSRGALNKEHFDWNDIADSAKKVMVSDLVLIFQQTKDEKKRKEARVFIGKSRLGPDKIELKIRADWSRSTIRG